MTTTLINETQETTLQTPPPTLDRTFTPRTKKTKQDGNTIVHKHKQSLHLLFFQHGCKPYFLPASTSAVYMGVLDYHIN